MINSITRLFRNTGKYRVTVDDVGVHYSRSHKKAFETFSAECQFAKLFSRPCVIRLLEVSDGDIIIEEFSYRGKKK